MNITRTYLRQISSAMTLVMMLTALWTIPSLASANTGIVGTGELLTEQQADLDQQALLNMLERQDVKDKLTTLGVSESEVKDRINSLTPAELASFKQQLAEAPAGEGVVGIIVLFLVIFIITDMLCATNIFPFIKCIR